MTTYTFQRGETVSIALDAVQGDPLTVSSITAAMKPIAAGRSSIDPAAPVTASFAVSARVAAGGNPAGWTLTLNAAASAALAAGTYAADARLTIGSGVVITDPVMIRMTNAVMS